MLDVLSELESIDVCIGYALNGQRIEYFPGHVNDLRNVKPIYETIPGWRQEITAARSLDDLPTAAINYVCRLEELIGRRIEFISVGPDRTQTITVGKDVSLDDCLQTRTG
jgi:adenylosuccinate synthase